MEHRSLHRLSNRIEDLLPTVFGYARLGRIMFKRGRAARRQDLD
jgi:hypothetical protein